MPDNTNPYMTVGAPSYAQPLMDWQGMANSIAGAFGQPQQQQKPPGQPGAPMNITPQAQNTQPTQAQGQMQGLGQRLMAMFGGGSPQAGAAGVPQGPSGPQAPVMGAPQAGAPQSAFGAFGAPQPPSWAPGPRGLY